MLNFFALISSVIKKKLDYPSGLLGINNCQAQFQLAIAVAIKLSQPYFQQIQSMVAEEEKKLRVGGTGNN